MVRVAALCLPGRRLTAVFLPSSCCLVVRWELILSAVFLSSFLFKIKVLSFFRMSEAVLCAASSMVVVVRCLCQVHGSLVVHFCFDVLVFAPCSASDLWDVL